MPSAQKPKALDETVIAQSRDLDRRFLEAHEQKDCEKFIAFSRNPEVFLWPDRDPKLSYFKGE